MYAHSGDGDENIKSAVGFTSSVVLLHFRFCSSQLRHTNTHTYTHTRRHAHTHAHSLARMHAHIHTYTSTHTYTNTHRHTHTKYPPTHRKMIFLTVSHFPIVNNPPLANHIHGYACFVGPGCAALSPAVVTVVNTTARDPLMRVPGTYESTPGGRRRFGSCTQMNADTHSL